MIAMEGVTRYYGEKAAVEDISIQIARGEMVGLLGPNGAGKTTIMKLLTGNLMPDEGQIVVDGIDVTEEPAKAAEKIGFMPEVPPLYPDMEVEHYLGFIADIRGMRGSDKEQRVEDALKTAQIEHVRDRVIGNLSKGYRQRVGLAQSLLGMPEILIFDEPTVGLDPRQIADFRALMVELSKDHTILFSTHILSEIDMVCQKVIILNEGRIVAVDSREDVKNTQQRTDVFLVRITGKKGEAVACLERVASKKQVTFIEESYDRSLLFRVSGAADDDVRQKVLRELAESGLALLELKNEQISLEQLYLDATAGGSGGKRA